MYIHDTCLVKVSMKGNSKIPKYLSMWCMDYGAYGDWRVFYKFLLKWD